MNKINNFAVLFITLALFTFSSDNNTYADEYFTENEDYYIETTITSDNITNRFSMNILTDNNSYIIPSKTLSAKSTNKTITKTKTSKIRAKDGTLLWSVSIKATFTYNGTTSKCTSYSHSASAPAKSWKIKSVSSNKKGNSATAVGVATHSNNSGSRDFTRSITIKCSKNGVVS